MVSAVSDRPASAESRVVPGRVPFNRPPRLSLRLSQASIEIPQPPKPAQKPSSSLGSGLLIPLIAVLGMGALFVFGAGAMQTESRFLFLAIGALGLASGLPVAWMFFEERRRFKRQLRQQVEQYTRRLDNVEAELVRLRDEEQTLRDEHDPPPARLIQRATLRSRRLWERRLADADFLSLRLGTGLAGSELNVDFHDERGSDVADHAPPSFARLLRDARFLTEQYASVPDVPIRLDLQGAGAAGLVGSYARTAALARAMLCQAAIHHSPQELSIVAFFDTTDDWAWLKWLPHVRDGGNTLLAWEPRRRQSLSSWLLDELLARKRRLDNSAALYAEPASASSWLLVFVEDLASAPVEPALRMALSDGQRLRVAVLGLADDTRSVPAGCGAVVVVNDDGETNLTYARSTPASAQRHLAADELGIDAAEQLARALAPLVLVDESPDSQAGDIPARLTFLEALGAAALEDVNLDDNWRLRDTGDLLRTPLGVAAGGELLWLDLKEQGQGGHGPHGLIAGTTGAGKSELLLTFIAGLALRHPPSVLNFVLIDYKGGDAFKTVECLPHTVSLITDLDPHLAARALLTLRSEIKRREHRLLEMRAAGIHTVAEYQASRGTLTPRPLPEVEGAPMPFLVIVVDEFARLKDELPEFITGLIDVARVGRSLGVHLVLATQTPSGTVDDQIQKNSNFGICLRVRDPLDSKQVIGEPDAALLPGSLPGRAYFRAGLDPIRLFQTARVRAPYEARARTTSFEISPFEPTHNQFVRTVSVGVAAAYRTTEIEALSTRWRELAAATGDVARAWPPALPDTVSLTAIVGTEPDWRLSADASLVADVGLVDEPTQQSQRPFGLDVGRNCLVYGGAASGKSTFLRTLAVSLAMRHSPSDLHIYCLDFDSRTLVPLAELPHCGPGGVFLPRDTVRIRRLFRMLEQELGRRRELGITNLRQQRRLLSDPPPVILVLLDNFAAFRETFEDEENLMRSADSMVADLATLMRDGSAAGINFVLSASVAGTISSSVANAAETRIVLRQNDATDYGIVGRLEHVPERMPPGRGFASGNPPREFQVADLDDPALISRLRTAAGGAGPAPIEDLPTRLFLADPRLLSGDKGIVLGLDDERFQPLTIDFDQVGHLVVMGPRGSGKTTLLSTIASQVDGMCRYVGRNVLQLPSLLDELESVVDERRSAPTDQHEGLLLVIDDYDQLRHDDEFYDLESRLARLVRRGSAVGLHVLLAGNNVELRDGRDEVLRYLTQQRVGVVLQPDVEFDGDLFSVRLRRLIDLPPVGRGYFIRQQEQRLFQAALP